MHIPLRPGLALLLTALLLAAPRPDDRAAAAPQKGAAVLRTLDAEGLTGTLAGLDAEHVTLKDGTGALTRHPLAGCIALDLPVAAARTRGEPRFRAYLTGGTALDGRVLGGQQDTLRIENHALGVVELLLDHILTLEALPATPDPCHDLAAKHPRSEEGDVAYDADGDAYRGGALGVDDAGITMETRGGREREVAWKALRVLHLENPRPKPGAGITAEIELHDGSRLHTAAAPVLEGTTLRFALRCLPTTPRRVELEHVRHVRWYGGDFVYASALPFESTHEQYRTTPADATYPAFLERWFGARVDRRSSGCPLRVGGVTFRHGFGVNSRSTITLALDGRYRTFRTWLGIDDEVLAEAGTRPVRGNVDARILADGKVLWEGKGIEGGQAPRRIGPLDVAGVKQLVLEVGFGEAAMTLDRADWGDPILVQAGP